MIDYVHTLRAIQAAHENRVNSISISGHLEEQQHDGVPAEKEDCLHVTRENIT